MLKGYEAMYDHGRVEWIGTAPRCAHARVLVVIEEPPGEEEECPPGDASKPNGDRLADLVEQWEAGSRGELMGKFGDPVAWQCEQRRDRHQPGRENA